MQSLDIVAYFFLLVALTIAPGPLVAMMIARTLNGDTKGAVGFGLGVALGDVLVIAVICLGLGTWLQASPIVFGAGKVIAILYVLWIAHGMWKGGDAPTATSAARRDVAAAIGAGVGICLVSPQTLLLYLLLLPQLIEINAVDFFSFAGLSLLTFVALFFSFGVVILATAKARTLTHRGAKSPLFSKALAVLVAGSGAWMVVA